MRLRRSWMIKLQVEEYCSNCPEFEPYVDRDVLEYYDFNLNEVYTEVNTIVSCEHKDRCNRSRKSIK